MSPEELLEAIGAIDDDLLAEAMLLPDEGSGEGLSAPLPAPAAPAGRKRIWLRYAAAAAVFVLLFAGVRFALSHRPKMPARTGDASLSETEGSEPGAPDASEGETALSASDAGTDGAATSGNASADSPERQTASVSARSGDPTRRPSRTAEEPAATTPAATEPVSGGTTSPDGDAEKNTRANAGSTRGATTKAPTTKAPTSNNVPDAAAKDPTTRKAETRSALPETTEKPWEDATVAPTAPSGVPVLFDPGSAWKSESVATDTFFSRYVRIFGADGNSGSGAGEAHGQELITKAPEWYTTAAPQESSVPTSRRDSPEIGASSYKNVPFFAFADQILSLEAELKKKAVFEEKSAAALEALCSGSCLSSYSPGAPSEPTAISYRQGVYHLAGEAAPIPLSVYRYEWKNAAGKPFRLLMYEAKDDGVHLSFPLEKLKATEDCYISADARFFVRSSADAIGPVYTALGKRGDTVLWLTLSGDCSKEEFLQMLSSCVQP